MNFKGNVAGSQTSGFVIRKWRCKLLVNQILFISEVQSLVVCYLYKTNCQFSVATEQVYDRAEIDLCF